MKKSFDERRSVTPKTARKFQFIDLKEKNTKQERLKSVARAVGDINVASRSKAKEMPTRCPLLAYLSPIRSSDKLLEEPARTGRAVVRNA